MKCFIHLFSGKSKENIVNLSPAEFAQSTLGVDALRPKTMDHGKGDSSVMTQCDHYDLLWGIVSVCSHLRLLLHRCIVLFAVVSMYCSQKYR